MASGMDPDSLRSDRIQSRPAAIAVVMGLAICAGGCAATNEAVPVTDSAFGGRLTTERESLELPDRNLKLIAFEAASQDSGGNSAQSDQAIHHSHRVPAAGSIHFIEVNHADAALPALESLALQQNPKLQRLSRQYAAARARIGYVDGLPDPKLAANFFVSPIETAAGAQRANMAVSQMLPWLKRLDAQKQQACFEAMALQQTVAAERLKIIADLRELWFGIYVIDRQLELSRANQQLVLDLVDVANARLATGEVAQSDVLAGTLEYSRIEEQIVLLRQRRASAVARLNRVAGRDAETEVDVPDTLKVALPDWNHESLRHLAAKYQPIVQSARIRTQATRWGIEVARLQRRPDFSLSASWFEIDSNRPAPNIVDVGRDAWALGATVSIPLWEQKYDAIEDEARWKHSSAHASVAELEQQFDARVVDLWQQAVAASDTAELYQNTILPQAQDTLEADQQAYATGTVDFDRVIRDSRNLLTLQTGYHTAIGQLAIALARIEQAVGIRP